MTTTPAHPKSVNEYLRRIGAEVLNFRRAMVKIHKGVYYIERAVVRIGVDGVVTCSVKDLEPTTEEAREMAAELAGIVFPRSVLARNADELRKKIGGAEIYEFWQRRGSEVSDGEGLIMCQERRIKANGVKSYVPWVMMDDGGWVSMEPDGDLPFWKPVVGRGPGCRIMIHEGAKSAAVAETIARSKTGEPLWGHPWREELSAYEHWGMIGGALAPHRTDYTELAAMAPTEVVYVCDNDDPGVSALQKVSKAWGRSMKGIRFGGKFPESWDMADPMPKEQFGPGGRWKGPSLATLMEPATWATEIIPPPPGQKGKGLTKITSAFASEWIHAVVPEVYIHREWPNRMYDAGQFDNIMAPFSHVAETSRALKREASSKVKALKYNPALAPGVYEDESTGFYINTHCPSSIVAQKGDPGIWLEFMHDFILGDLDRHETFRWLATLIARPDIRMLYGLLLVSETQGVGKGTIADKILRPLIGTTNVSVPTEKVIVESVYNYWVAHKRLAIVHEIYSGQSSKAYNNLKSIIADDNITVSKKYQPDYEIENWIHLFACSNSMKALKVAMDDRRLLIPRLSEKRQNSAYWERLNAWIADDGLPIIRWWAEQFVAEHGPVNKGEIAPWTDSKREMVEEGYSPGQAHVSNKLGMVRNAMQAGELPKDSFLVDTLLVDSIRNELHEGRVTEYLEKPRTVRQVALGDGWLVGAHKSTSGKFVRGSRVITLDAETAGTTLEALTAAGRAPVNLTRVGAM